MTFIAYHGTSANFTRFDVKQTAQGIIWFSKDRDKIARGDAGAQGRSRILRCRVTLKKPAGWAEYERYGLGELKSLGYDGAMLDDDGFVFRASQIKILGETP